MGEPGLLQGVGPGSPIGGQDLGCCIECSDGAPRTFLGVTRCAVDDLASADSV